MANMRTSVGYVVYACARTFALVPGSKRRTFTLIQDSARGRRVKLGGFFACLFPMFQPSFSAPKCSYLKKVGR